MFVHVEGYVCTRRGGMFVHVEWGMFVHVKGHVCTRRGHVCTRKGGMFVHVKGACWYT